MNVFRVAGVSFDGRQEFLKKIFESKEKLDLSFEREPDNPYDSNAIKVMINIGGELFRIGYVPKLHNVKFTEHLPVLHSYRILDFGPRYSKGLELYVK